MDESANDCCTESVLRTYDRRVRKSELDFISRRCSSKLLGIVRRAGIISSFIALVHHFGGDCAGPEWSTREFPSTYLFRAPMLLSYILSTLQPLQYPLNGCLLLFQFLHLQTLATSSRLFLDIFQRLLGELDVLDTQFLADDIKISDRVNVALDVDDLGIVEASNDLEDGIDRSNVRQESVAETRTGRRTSCQASDIVDSQVGWYP